MTLANTPSPSITSSSIARFTSPTKIPSGAESPSQLALVPAGPITRGPSTTARFGEGLSSSSYCGGGRPFQRRINALDEEEDHQDY